MDQKEVQQDIETYHNLRCKVVNGIELTNEEQSELNRVAEIVRQFYDAVDCTLESPEPGSLMDRIYKFLEEHNTQV